jgi:hypothetical protein
MSTTVARLTTTFPNTRRSARAGTALERIGQEICEQLEVFPAKVRVLRHIRRPLDWLEARLRSASAINSTWGTSPRRKGFDEIGAPPRHGHAA